LSGAVALSGSQCVGWVERSDTHHVTQLVPD
jgi:hypothetical protein